MLTETIIYIIIAFIVSFAMTAFLTPQLIKLCHLRNVFDTPDERKVHSERIPRLGGLLFMPAMMMGVTSGILGGYTFFSGAELSTRSILIAIGMFFLYLIGIFDDIFGIEAKMKFIIQLFVSLFLPFCGLYIHNLYGLFGLYELHPYISYGLTVLLSLLIVNAINLIDGIDGLSSMLSMIALTVFGGLYLRHELYFYALFSFALLGSVAAFFYFNVFGKTKRHTKTFMGDTGSLTLGYALTFLAVKYVTTNFGGQGETSFYTALLIPFTLLFVPCIDLVRVALWRVKGGHSMFHPDKTHIHHKCMEAGLTMHGSLFAIVALQIVIGLVNLATILADTPATIIFSLDLAIYALFFLLLRLIKRKKVVA